MYCYRNNGLSVHSVEDDYVAQSGEFLSVDIATPQQLSAAFTGYASAASEQSIQDQIIFLEGTQTPRRIREAANGTDNGWMKGLDAQIEALREQL